MLEMDHGRHSNDDAGDRSHHAAEQAVNADCGSWMASIATGH
jgi:hypothetical protein